MRQFVVLGLISTTAFAFTLDARDARADEPAPAFRPAFSMMDNTGDGTEVDLSFPVAISTQSGTPDTVIRPRLLVQGLTDQGFGGYGILELASQLGNTDVHNTGIGNLELGGLYHTVLSPNLDLGVRVGAAVATSSDSTRLTNSIASYLIRPADLAASLPGNWLRVGISPTYHDGIAFARLDAGLDIPVTDRDRVDGASLAHVNVGAGVAIKQIIATAELQTLFQLNGQNGTDLSKLYTAGASVRYQGRNLSPYLGVSFPLGNDLTGDFVNVTAGITGAL